MRDGRTLLLWEHGPKPRTTHGCDFALLAFVPRVPQVLASILVANGLECPRPVNPGEHTVQRVERNIDFELVDLPPEPRIAFVRASLRVCELPVIDLLLDKKQERDKRGRLELRLAGQRVNTVQVGAGVPGAPPPRRSATTRSRGSPGHEICPWQHPSTAVPERWPRSYS